MDDNNVFHRCLIFVSAYCVFGILGLCHVAVVTYVYCIDACSTSILLHCFISAPAIEFSIVVITYAISLCIFTIRQRLGAYCENRRLLQKIKIL